MVATPKWRLDRGHPVRFLRAGQDARDPMLSEYGSSALRGGWIAGILPASSAVGQDARDPDANLPRQPYYVHYENITLSSLSFWLPFSQFLQHDFRQRD